MNLEKIVAISGRSGLFRMVSNRPNGLIVEDLDNKKRFFVSSRLTQFTPLASISIYTTSDDLQESTVELKEVFKRMLEQISSNPPADGKADGPELRNYFERILPEHDREKVMISDIKKLIKWFAFLNERNLLSLTEEETETTAAEETAE